MQARQLPANERWWKVEHSRCNPFSVKAPASARNPGKICLVERSHRIWQVSQKRFDHSGYWWVTPMSLFQYSSWSVFSPPTPENGWVLGGTVFCRSKVLWNPPSTLNPELLQHWVLKIFRWWTWETTCQDHRYYVKNIDLKTWMTGSLQETNNDKNPQTEATKLHSACKKVASDKPQKN